MGWLFGFQMGYLEGTNLRKGTFDFLLYELNKLPTRYFLHILPDRAILYTQYHRARKFTIILGKSYAQQISKFVRMPGSNFQCNSMT